MNSKQVSRRASAALEMELMDYQARVEVLASKILQKRTTVRLNRLDALRLMNILYWSNELQVSDNYILGVLLPYWVSATYIKRRRAIFGLGIRVATLVGKKSKEVLLQQIAKDFPAQQHVTQRQSEIESSIALNLESLGLLRVRDPQNLIAAYTDRIEHIRAALGKFRSSMRKRSWRGNPYLNGRNVL